MAMWVRSSWSSHRRFITFETAEYLAYTDPKVQAHAKAMLLLAPLDGGIRGVTWKYLGDTCRNPMNLLKRLHLQSVTIIQPWRHSL